MLVSFWTLLETHIGSVPRIKTFTKEAVREDLEAEKEVPAGIGRRMGGLSLGGEWDVGLPSLLLRTSP